MGSPLHSLREIGRLGKPHGVRGEIHMVPVSRDTDRLLDLGRVFTGADEQSAVERPLMAVRQHLAAKGPVLLLSIKGFADRDEVSSLRGQLVFAAEEDLPVLEEDEFYYSDIVGFRVETPDGDVVGRVTDVLDRPPQDLLVVGIEDGEDAYVPLVNEFVEQVDLAGGRVDITPIEGMFPGN